MSHSTTKPLSNVKAHVQPVRQTSRLQLLRCCLAELFGVAVFTSATLGAGRLAELDLIPDLVAFTVVPGLSLLLLIYALSDLSGTHINPAMTLAFALRGSFPWKRVPLYWVSQLLGGYLAARLMRLLFVLPHAPERVTPSGAFGLEVAVTFLLVTVVLATSNRQASLGISSALAVSGTLTLCHLLTNPLTAISLNPARSLGVYLVDGRSGVWPHLWGPVLGAVLAVGLTWALRGRQEPQENEAAQGEKLPT